MNGDTTPGKGSYEYDLWVHLDGVIQTYQEDRDLFWQDHGGAPGADLGRIMYERGEKFADLVLSGAKDLVLEEDGCYDEQLLVERKEFFQRFHSEVAELSAALREVARKAKVPTQEVYATIEQLLERQTRPDEDLPVLRLAWEGLEARLASEMVGKIPLGAIRLVRLWDLLLEARPARSVVAYLRMVSRCYVAGFGPECVICCRSAVEEAFNDAVPDSMCERELGIRRDGYFVLADRIAVATKRGLTSENVQAKARCVRERGNKAVHGDSGATTDVLGTIRDTLDVLRELTCSCS